MAALTMTPPAVRQPFAPLDASRMRSLMRSKMNVVNKQNGTTAPNLRVLYYIRNMHANISPKAQCSQESVSPSLNQIRRISTQ